MSVTQDAAPRNLRRKNSIYRHPIPVSRNIDQKISFHDVAVRKPLLAEQRRTAAQESLDVLIALMLYFGQMAAPLKASITGDLEISWLLPSGKRSGRSESGCPVRICCDSFSAVQSISRGPLRAQGAITHSIWPQLEEVWASFQIKHVPAHSGVGWKRICRRSGSKRDKKETVGY